VLAALLGTLALPLSAADADADRIALAVEALTRLEVDLNSNPAMKERVLKVLDKTRGTPNFLRLVQHFKLQDQNAGLLEIALAQPAGEGGVEATRLILAGSDTTLLQKTLEGTNLVDATRLAEALGNTGQKESTPLLLPMVGDSQRDATLRRQGRQIGRRRKIRRQYRVERRALARDQSGGCEVAPAAARPKRRAPASHFRTGEDERRRRQWRKDLRPPESWLHQLPRRSWPGY
jgi:hypothetical protein